MTTSKIWVYSTYCWWFRNPARNPANQLKYVVYPTSYKALATIQTVLGLGISEPSTVLLESFRLPGQTSPKVGSRSPLKNRLSKGHVFTHHPKRLQSQAELRFRRGFDTFFFGIKPRKSKSIRIIVPGIC